MTLRHNDDTSLQAWGRNLGLVGPALEELAKRQSDTAAEHAEAATAIEKIAQQADSDLPVSPVLNAEMQSIAAEMRHLQAEAEARAARYRALVGRAEALPTTYRREHETDEDRLNAPRRSRAAEKRADVTTAEQDT